MKTQHNTFLRFLVLTLIILSIFTNNIIAQCCDGNNKIRIENKADCSFGLKISCETSGGTYTVIKPTPIVSNDLPLISNPTNCPRNTAPLYDTTVACGGPFNTQWASVLLGANCSNCSNFKIEVIQVNGTTSITGSNTIYTNSTGNSIFNHPLFVVQMGLE